MEIPFPAMPQDGERNDRWRQFGKNAYASLEAIAKEKVWFLASLLLLPVAFGVVEIIAFGPAPEHDQGPDPYGMPRFILALFESAASFFLTVGMVGILRLWLQGRDAGWKELLETSFSLWLKTLAVAILFFLGTVIGLVLLIVPGIWFALTYGFAITAMAANRNLSIPDAFRASKAMTVGNRWKILVVSVWLGFSFWWNKGGKWVLAITVIGLALLAGYAAGMNAVKIPAFVVLGTGLVGVGLTALYATIVTQYAISPLIFFGLTKPEKEQAEHDDKAPATAQASEA
jgi:hypothetical protein